MATSASLILCTTMMSEQNQSKASLAVGGCSAISKQTKRARYMHSWESSLFAKGAATTRGVKLNQLFDAREWQGQVQNGNQHPKKPYTTPKTCNIAQGNPPVTLRLEHREGGPLATHPGEERILLFRSDRPGAIAKIIYSSVPAEATSLDDDQIINRENQANNLNEGEVARAYIHVLDVKESYRGHDFGGLLFLEAMSSLRHRYLETDEGAEHTDQQSTGDSTTAGIIRCQLDAEEDVRRHNQLVGFYERLGCKVRSSVKPQFLNNNDGETYRKVPMERILVGARRNRLSGEASSCLTGSDGGQFLPVQLLGYHNQQIMVFEAEGKDSGSSNNITNQSRQRVHWLLAEDGQGHVQFLTTHGENLVVGKGGRCFIRGDTSNIYGDRFVLLRVSDGDQVVVSGDDDCTDDKNSNGQNKPQRKELWIIQALEGMFLGLDSLGLHCSKTPAFWKADSSRLSLAFTNDTPARRQHYRRMWIKQTVQYNLEMRRRYLGFELSQMTLKQALDLLRDVSGFPFSLEPVARSLSLRTLSFRTAQAARAAGHPDWIQFIALIHALGSIVNRIDMASAVDAQDDFDWTILCRSRVVGCRSPDTAFFAEFSSLNRDVHNGRYNDRPQGMYSAHCGLQAVLLSWSAPEYMYHMLRHNKVDLPEEGLAILRLFSLSDWHMRHLYEVLANDDDWELLPFVSDFDYLCRRARRETFAQPEILEDECDLLWESHYAMIAAKYSCGEHRLLRW